MTDAGSLHCHQHGRPSDSQWLKKIRAKARFLPRGKLGKLGGGGEDPSFPWDGPWISFQFAQLSPESHLCGSDVTNWEPVGRAGSVTDRDGLDNV